MIAEEEQCELVTARVIGTRVQDDSRTIDHCVTKNWESIILGGKKEQAHRSGKFGSDVEIRSWSRSNQYRTHCQT